MDTVPPLSLSAIPAVDEVTLTISSGLAAVKDGGIDENKLATYAVIFDKLSDSVRVTYRNMLVNGMGWVAQRPTYTASVSGTYGYGKCDRWAGAITGSTVAGTLTQSTTSTVSGTMGFGIKWSAVTTTGSGVVKFRQRIEAKNTLKYLAKDLKFTCWLTQDTGSTVTATITLRSADVLDNFSATTLIQTVAGSVSIPTGTATQVTGSFSPVSNALTNGIELEVAVTIGAVSNKYVELTVAQLWIDDGSTAEGFEVLPWSVEYERCQRYYWKSFPYATAPAQNCGSQVGAIGVQCETVTPTAGYGTQVWFPVQMRTTPTVTFYNPLSANTKWYNIGDGADSGVSSTKSNLSANGFYALNGGKDSTDEQDFHVIHATAEAEL